MKVFLFFLSLVCYTISLGEARQANFAGDNYVDTIEPTENSDITRKEYELNKLYEVAKERIRDKVNAKTNTGDIVRNLIETNATGLQHGYPSSCPPYSQAHGIYTVNVTGFEPFPVFCDTSIAGAGWTVIQRRIHGNINFFRNWTEYKKGFGNIDDEFFIGLDKLHAITATTQHELYILLEDFEGNKRHARYEDFLVGNETAGYNLTSVGCYSGDAGDSLIYHVGSKFSTYDKKNHPGNTMCAEDHMGAWWYYSCAQSSLNGLYLHGVLYNNLSAKGILWTHWKGRQSSYKYVQMMIRPKCIRSYED